MRRRRQDIHVNQERWLVSYADFITLLFAFFVVMYSISQVSESKYRVLSDTFGQAFHQSSDKTTKNTDASTKQVIAPIEFDARATTPNTGGDIVPLNTDADAIVDVSTVNDTPSYPDEPLETSQTNNITSDELTQISDLVSEKFRGLIENDLIKVASNELWLEIQLKDSILFASAQADPSAQAIAIFGEVAAILKNYENPIQIEGYTDNVPISSSRYPTNWELSTARASSIVKLLAEQGVNPARLSAVGFGEFQPVADNKTVEGRAQNRRVSIMVAKRKMDRPQ